jgi:predicted DNA binding CopG/RHH family protein
MPEKKVPAFRTEAEEARWWYRHRARLDRDFVKAARRGHLRRLTRKKLAARIKASTRVISIRVAEKDLALARRQASKKGLPYQTYIKSLLHQALRSA